MSDYRAPELDDVSDFNKCFEAFRPFPPTRLLAWSLENIVTDQGRPYDHLAYPHLAAPGGPMDAYDDHNVRTISEQFATRLGKTFFGLTALLYQVDKDPCPMLLASESQDALKRVMGRMYKMVYGRDRLNKHLLIRARKDHKQDHIRFFECDIKGAWARSAGSLADVNIKVGLANELDKEGWDSKSTTKEGAPIKLFDDRLKDYQSVRKVIYECTPTVKGVSRIERLRLSGWNCTYHVPCPRCKQYQMLRLAHKDEHGKLDLRKPGRIAWNKPEHGKEDRDLARRTAHYVCEHCEGKLYDDSRPWMMRRGVWVPEGCTAKSEEALATIDAWYEGLWDDAGWDDVESPWKGWDEAAWIDGTPARNGPDASYQLSSLYALSLGWGDIAAEFVACKDRPQFLRNFVNQWLGDTWEHIHRKQTWEQLGIKIIDDGLPRFHVPEWASMVTVGADRQQDHYVYVVDAWGPDRRHATIGYGDCEDIDDIINGVSARYYEHADGGDAIRPTMTLIDSGFRPEGVYEACRDAIKQKINVLPCKGTNKSIESDYRQATLGKDTSSPGMVLVHVDTIRTQAWIDKTLHAIQPEDPGGMALHAGTLEEHQDFLEQMLNDAAVTGLDSTNNEREAWERVNVDIPNDMRDCRRYSYVAMLLATRGRPIKERKQETKKRAAVVSTGAARRDGRGWFER